MTHIENILPEVVGGEVHRLSMDDADKLSATAIKDIVTHSTGCSLAMPDGSPTTDVEELIALCTAVLRAHWQKPLTMLDGQSLQDLIRRLIGDRVKGDDTFGIPDANNSVSEALSALLDRKISGAPEVADGMSLVRLFCDSAVSLDTLTTLTDTTTGWTMDKRLAVKTNFANCQTVTLNCAEIDCGINDYNGGTMLNSDVEYHLPSLKKIVPQTTSVGFGHGIFDCAVQTHDIYMPELEEITSGSNFGIIRGINAPNNAEPFALYAPKLKRLGSRVSIFRRYNACTTGVSKVVLGVIETEFTLGANDYGYMATPNLIHLEFGQGTNASLNLVCWSPTTALSSNLLQFLSNFREFLFLRLADRTDETALTLTLSQAVYQAITGTDTTTTALTLTLADLGVTELTEKELEAGITLATTYATWLETYRDRINWNIGYV